VGLAYFFDRVPTISTVTLPAELSRGELSEVLGDALRWSAKERNEFMAAHTRMQWMEFSAPLADVLTKKFSWKDAEREVFLISSERYTVPHLDVLRGLYASGVYVISAKEATPALVAGMLVSRTKEAATSSTKSFVEERLSKAELANLREFVRGEVELLPDLVPFPAQDLVLEKSGENVFLRFSTIYYNQGRGPLEIIADPKTKGIRADLERNVFQRIYRTDGGSRDLVSGEFLWHQEHLHYHFADFVIYDLEAVNVSGPAPDLSGVRAKSTFCIRDISRIDLTLPNRTEAQYKICGKERQGISVGWGDTYFFTYPDQLLNVVDLPSGTYRLTFHVNPENRFEESRTDNNTSSATIKLDVDKLKVEVIAEEPSEYPELEHVYEEQVFE